MSEGTSAVNPAASTAAGTGANLGFGDVLAAQNNQILQTNLAQAGMINATTEGQAYKKAMDVLDELRRKL